MWSTGIAIAWVRWCAWFESEGKARQAKARQANLVLHARTHAVTHSLAASLANKNVFNEPFAAQRLEPPRATQSQRVGWSAFPLSPKICNQPSHPSGPPPPSSIPSLALRSITAFLLLPPYFPTAITTLSLRDTHPFVSQIATTSKMAEPIKNKRPEIAVAP